MTFPLLGNQIDCFEVRLEKSKLSGIEFELSEHQKNISSKYYYEICSMYIVDGAFKQFLIPTNHHVFMEFVHSYSRNLD